MAYQIKNWLTGAVIHEFGDSAKESLENGVANGVNFAYAELNGAELNGAELNGAELNGAELNGAKLNGAKLNGAELNDAELNDAELNDAELNGAELNGAKLNDAELNYAKLNDAELNGADTHSIKYEFFGKLAVQYSEIAGLREAIIGGQIDGSVYKGECACFIGTIANIKHIPKESLAVEVNANSLTERWFLGISKGDTPVTNPIARITLEWIDEFLRLTEKVGRNRI